MLHQSISTVLRVVRVIVLSVAAVAIFYSTESAIHAQELRNSQEQTAINTLDVARLSTMVSEHQAKIETIEVALAVVKSDSEANNKILWGLLTGIVMLVIERVVGFANGRRKQEDTEES
jgi:hypothetical protein